MLTKLDVLGLRTFAPTLPLDDGGIAVNDPLQILKIDGLDPVKAAITTTPFGAFDGEAYMGSSVGKRNIVLTIGLNPDWKTQTYEELRQLLYNYFMPKLFVRLQFTSTHLPVCQIDGYVESMEPNMFSKSPQVAVSIICPRPDFVAVDKTTITGTTNDGSSSTEADYIGSVTTGVVIKVTQATGTPGEDTIQVNFVCEYESQVFASKGNLTPTVYFEMSSVPGEKYVHSVSTALGTITNYLNSVAVDADWLELYPGRNAVSVITPVVGQNWELSYFARFGGL